jgi:hypothetical protein
MLLFRLGQGLLSFLSIYPAGIVGPLVLRVSQLGLCREQGYSERSKIGS